MNYTDLPGWFDYGDLYDRIVADAREGAVFVELGVYAARSLAYLAQQVQASGKQISIYGVDRFDEISLATVADSLRQCGCEGVELVKLDSAEAAKCFPDGSIDFIFIDADHSYEGVARDIAAWRPKMKFSGTMAGHDRVRIGVHKAVMEAFGRYEPVGPLAWVVRL